MRGTTPGYAWILPVLLLCAVAAGVPDGGGAPLVPLRIGEAYGQARVALLRSGWKPRRRGAGSDCAAGIPDQRCRLFPETASCSHTGLGFCRFEWISPRGRILAVITQGGDLRGDPGVVRQWFDPGEGGEGSGGLLLR